MRRISFVMVDFNGKPIEKRTLTLGASVGSSFSENGYGDRSLMALNEHTEAKEV